MVTFDRDYSELVFARGEPPPLAIVYLRQQPYRLTRPANLLLSLLSRTDDIGKFKATDFDAPLVV